MSRVAVVDIGSNSTRLLVAELSDDRQRVTAELARESNVTRLGQGVDGSGRLAGEAMERVHAVLAGYRDAIDEHGADRAVAVLTSAVRDAANGREFAGVVRDRFGLEPHVLEGEDEARLTFLGATSERDPDERQPTLVVDVGGGSTELVIGIGHEMHFHVSTQAGVVRQSERHIDHDPPSAPELEELRADVRATLAAAVPPEPPPRGHPRDCGRGDGDVAGGDRAAARALRPGPGPRVCARHPHPGPDPRRAVRDDAGAAALRPGTAPRPGPDDHPGRADPRVRDGAVRLERLEISEHDILRGAAIGLTAR